MEPNITNQQYFNDNLPPAEPHFDEEATVLSARPVVPLEEIKNEERSKKRLIFGLALTCSLMLGALGGTLIYKRRGQESSTIIVNAEVAGVAGNAVVEPTPAITEAVGGDVAGMVPKAGTPKSIPANSHSAAAGMVEVKRKRILPVQVDGTEQSRAERIAARRLRRRYEREAWREAGGHHRRSADDLLRIREIFEGPSRP